MKKRIIVILSIFCLLLTSCKISYIDKTLLSGSSQTGIKTLAPFVYEGNGPLDAKQSFDTKSDMASFDEEFLDNGMRAYCKEDNTWYEFNENNVSNGLTGKWAKIKTIQYTEMPTPTSDLLGEVYQYVGQETPEYKSGYFYKVEQQGSNYVYKQTNVQDQVKIDPIVLDTVFRADTYNANKLNIQSSSIKIYNGMIYANIVATYKTKKTDISSDKETILRLPEIPATASTTYPSSCQVTITTPINEYITCEQNRHDFFDSSGEHYVSPNCAIGEPFYINNFTKIENAYSDAAHTQPINICEANLTTSGVAVIGSDGINVEVKKHGVSFNIGGTLPETLYRCTPSPIKYIERTEYYDNTGTKHTGLFYELETVSLTPDTNYLYQCKLVNEMRKYCGENYMVDETGKICKYLITENALSKTMGAVYNLPQDIGYGFGIDGSIEKTYEKDKGFSYSMNAEIDPLTRQVKIPGVYPIEKISLSINGQ